MSSLATTLVQSDITRITKRGSCYEIEGVVRHQGEWVKSSFTMFAPDFEAMSDQQMRDFAKRTFPDTRVDANWTEHQKV